MSRSTQYIGFTKKAWDFINKLTDLNYIEHIECKENVTDGMFGEDIPLSTWKDKDGVIYTETLQVSPWSSGPMLFTYLKTSYGGNIFLWKEDQSLKDKHVELDHEKGTYYI
jgi:hypothetical protein